MSFSVTDEVPSVTVVTLGVVVIVGLAGTVVTCSCVPPWSPAGAFSESPA